MKYSTVIFDLDGTLLNTLDDIADSANTVLRRVGYPTHEVESYKYLVGEGIEKLVRRALGDDNADDAFVARCVDEMRQEYSQRWSNNTRPYDGVPELLDSLASRRVSMNILSNKPDDFTNEMVDALLPGRTFDIVRGLIPSVPAKPDPTAAFRIAEDRGIGVEECVFVGDSNIDIQTAVAARMLPVGVLWGFRPGEELTAAGAKKLLHNPLELLDLF
jgi:phosphoglycolate phosphatase